MRRPLIWAAISYLCGLVLGESLTYYPLTVMGLLFIGGGAGCVWLGRSAGSRKTLFLIAGLVLFGMIRLQIAERISPADDPARFATRAPVRLIGTVAGPLQHGPESIRLILNARSITQNGEERSVHGKVRLTIIGFIPDLEYGDRIRVDAKLRPPSGMRNPGGFDYAASLQRAGIRTLATIRRPEAVERLSSGGFPPLRRIYAWREEIRRMLDGSLSPVSSAILQAMLIGETGSLSPKIREAFMISGTTHLLSISGSHLALVGFVVFHLSGRILRRTPAGWLLQASRRLTATRLSVLITLAPIVFYTLLAGGQVATVRSLVMILVYLAAVWFQRTDDPLNALGVAALLIVLWDPCAVFSISFQLSFVAVLAMVLSGANRFSRDEPAFDSEREASWTARRVRTLRAYLKMTVAAGAATLPLTAFYFNQISWVGFLSNLIAVPLVGMVIVPLGLACSVGAVLFDRTVLPMAGFNDGLARGLFSMVEGFARFPASELHVPSPPVPVLLSIYLAGLLTASGAKRIWNRTAIGLCFLIALIWIVRLPVFHADGRLRVAFLDVGQGDAAWIELPDGKTMLIDGGGAQGNFDPGRLAVAPYLWNTGHRRIDYLVATHPQRDHIGGLGYIAEKFKIGEVWTNGMKKNAEFYDRIHRILLDKAITERTIAGDGRPLLLRPATILPLHPQTRDSTVSDNDRSLVLRVEYGQAAVLFTGDIERGAERELLRWGDRLRSTILKVPHHGSRSSIDPDFLSRVSPSAAVISVGAANPYRHPSPETLSAYAALGTRLYRTDRNGAVIFQTDGEHWTVRTYAESVPQPVSWGRGMASAEALNYRKLFRRSGFEPT